MVRVAPMKDDPGGGRSVVEPRFMTPARIFFLHFDELAVAPFVALEPKGDRVLAIPAQRIADLMRLCPHDFSPDTALGSFSTIWRNAVLLARQFLF